LLAFSFLGKYLQNIATEWAQNYIIKVRGGGRLKIYKENNFNEIYFEFSDLKMRNFDIFTN
jgi:hypothetical protein